MQIDKLAAAGWCLGPPPIPCDSRLSQPQISVLPIEISLLGLILLKPIKLCGIRGISDRFLVDR